MSAGVVVFHQSMASSVQRKRVAVLGAGTVGLSCALKMVQRYGRSVEVTIIAAEFLQQTTSYSCGGLWEPYQIAGTPDESINQWGKIAFEHYRDLFNSRDAVEAGVQLVNCYQLFEAHDKTAEPSWKDIVFNFDPLSQEDIQKMGLPNNYVRGFKFGTYVVDQKYYMQYLTKKLTALGVKYEQKRLTGIQEVMDRGCFDCIINCTGLGAGVVVKDESVYPIRGQVLRLRAPWIKDIWFFGTSYLIPNVDTVVAGGTAGRGDWNTSVSLEDTKRILDNIEKVFPAIRSAPIESAWVGLRPGRTPLRLESEVMSSNGRRSTPVVHCYGHGGSGITLAMGCAEDVVTNHVSKYLGGGSSGGAPVREDFKPRSRL